MRLRVYQGFLEGEGDVIYLILTYNQFYFGKLKGFLWPV